MILFACDLDNTLLYSYRRNIGAAIRCVEVYQNREISFVTEKTHALLREARRHTCVVPVTTRTEEQYTRIDFGMEAFPCALTCNGGVLLLDGAEDASWYAQSLALVEESRDALAVGEDLMRQDKNRNFEVRNIRGLFLFTKSEKPLASARMLKRELRTERADVFTNGAKVYLVPRNLNKGTALMRLRKRLGPDLVIAAGDSVFDVPMLCEADVALAPAELKQQAGCPEFTRFMPGREVFSEELLSFVLNCAASKKISDIAKVNEKITDK